MLYFIEFTLKHPVVDTAAAQAFLLALTSDYALPAPSTATPYGIADISPDKFGHPSVTLNDGLELCVERIRWCLVSADRGYAVVTLRDGTDIDRRQKCGLCANVEDYVDDYLGPLFKSQPFATPTRSQFERSRHKANYYPMAVDEVDPADLDTLTKI